MQRAEIAELIEYLSLIDGRKVTPEKIQAWFDVIGFLDYAAAKAAMLECQRDSAIAYIEPKHIVSAAARIKERARNEAARVPSLETKAQINGTRMPKCEHGIGILFCDPCCKQAAVLAGLIK
jgi:hypothetical protein